MQKTRQKILEYLKERGEASVEELSVVLDNLTPVTVRHHLDVMRSEGLVESPEIRHRASPGRPRYMYRLSSNAETLFPSNLNTLTGHLIGEMKRNLNENQINVIFEGVADLMAAGSGFVNHTEPMAERLTRTVTHLTEHGYMASWEESPEGFILHTRNCPYGVADKHPELCVLDMRYISSLLGVVPRRMAHMLEGDSSCSYLIPQQ